MRRAAMSADRLIVSRVATDRVIDLRHRVLRDGLPRDAAHFEGDDEPTTIHLAALDAWDLVVGCCTILRRPWNGRPAWQLRGMAVDPRLQRQGIGGLLLAEVERTVLASDHSRELWCNARRPAVRFYERHGWQVASPEFDIPTAGPHYKMVRKLAE